MRALWVSGIGFGAALAAMVQECTAKPRVGYGIMAVCALVVAVLVFTTRDRHEDHDA